MNNQEKKFQKQREFHWTVYGMCVAAFFIMLCATYFILRIIDGNWGQWQLPVILGIIFIVGVVVSAMFCSLADVKREIEKRNTPKEE